MVRLGEGLQQELLDTRETFNKRDSLPFIGREVQQKSWDNMRMWKEVCKREKGRNKHDTLPTIRNRDKLHSVETGVVISETNNKLVHGFKR